MVWHEHFLHTSMGVGRGARIWKFQQKAVFLVSGGKKQISSLLAPLEKLLEKSNSGPPWKNSFRRPCIQVCKVAPFLWKIVLYYKIVMNSENTAANMLEELEMPLHSF